MEQYLSEISQLILKEAGWSPTRTADVSSWVKVLHANGYEMFDEAEKVLREFGGLRVLTESFREKPFYLSGQQKVTLHHRFDPLMEFLPEEILLARKEWIEICKILEYLREKNLSFVPIGSLHCNGSYVVPLLLLSDGTIALGTWTLGDKTDDKIFYLQFLGGSLKEALNEVLNQFLVFW